MARYYYTKDKNKTVQRTRYYYGLDNDNQLYHFGFKIPDIKLPDIGKIADDVFFAALKTKPLWESGK